MDTKGSTISFREIPEFDQLSLEEASRIIYEELLPACEEKGVMLSEYGNELGSGSLQSNMRIYRERRNKRMLFDVERIQKAFFCIPIMFGPVCQYNGGSYSLKHDVENHPCQKEYITNGDFIIAMLFRGYKARFGKRTEPNGVNCDFQVKLKKY